MRAGARWPGAGAYCSAVRRGDARRVASRNGATRAVRGARLARKRARRGARRIHTGEPLALVGTLTIVANVGAASAKDSFDLKGEVYQAYKIEMKNSVSRPLKTVKAETHRIKIEDKGTIHNFHLIGPGVDRWTSIAGRSETVWAVKLKARHVQVRLRPARVDDARLVPGDRVGSAAGPQRS
jgi:hypothetical protein